MLTTLPTTSPEPVILTASGERRSAWRVAGSFRIVLPRVGKDGGEGGTIASARDAGEHWIVCDPHGSYYVLPLSGAVTVAEVDAARERERLAADAARLMDVSGPPEQPKE